MNVATGGLATPAQATPTGPWKDVETTLNYVGDIKGPRGILEVFNPERSTIVWDPRQVVVRDVRPHVDELTLDGAGMQFVKHRSAFAEDPALFDGNLKARNMNAAGLSAQYEEELCGVIQKLTGAREVFPRLGGLVIRTSGRHQSKGWAPPAEFAHMDFAASAMPMWLEMSLKAKGRTLAPFRRMMLIQAWRAVSPGPQDSTLGVCDGRTVPKSDCVFVDSMIGPREIPGNSWESRLSRYRDSHSWYYMPDMQPDDLILFKGYDSDTPDAMNAMHSAFNNPLGQNGEPRRSMEARIIAIFD